MQYVLGLLATFALSSTVVWRTTKNWSRTERVFAWFAIPVNIGGSFAVYELTRSYYGYGDLLSYLRRGELIASYLRTGGDTALDNVIAMLFQFDGASLPIPMLQGTTGTMFALSGLLTYVFQHQTVVNAFVAAFGLSGQLLLADVCREKLDGRLRRVAIATLLLLPSLVYWTGGMLKETIAMAAMGILIHSLAQLESQKQLLGRGTQAFKIGLGAWMLSLSKPFMLFPLIVAVTVYLIVLTTQRRNRHIRGFEWVLGLLVALSGVVALSMVMPSYSLERLPERFERAQEIGRRIQGGSNYELNAFSREGKLQPAALPLALITVFFRPFFFEVKGFAAALNGAETTVVSVLFLLAMTRIRAGWKLISTTPFLASCLALCAVAGIGVGLYTSNLGTLSRYRTPFFPFFVILLASVVTQRKKASARRKPIRFEDQFPTLPST